MSNQFTVRISFSDYKKLYVSSYDADGTLVDSTDATYVYMDDGSFDADIQLDAQGKITVVVDQQ